MRLWLFQTTIGFACQTLAASIMKSIFTVILWFTTLSVLSQDFEGKVTYQNKYKSKIPQVTTEQLTSMLGTSQEYFLKNGNYKSVTNGTFSNWQLYINKDNKLYTKLSNKDTVYWQDASVFTDSIINFKINKNAVKICGYDCDEIIIKCKNSRQTFYFSSKFKINSDLFKKHKCNMWYDYLKLTNAVPLKIIMDSPQYSIENVAVEIKPLKLKDSDFLLPKNTVTTKSRY